MSRASDDTDPARPERAVAAPGTHSTDDLSQRLDALLFEVRKQGRAGVAAQASAEACLRAVDKLSTSTRVERDTSAVREETLVAVVEALLPVLDAIDGAVSQARQSAHGEVAGKRTTSPSLLRRVGGRLLGTTPAACPDHDSRHALVTGVALIQSEVRRALRRVGVEIESRVGVSVDPERHRVVEVQTARSSKAPATSSGGPSGTASMSTVQAVLRPGYFVGGRCVREADVVAAGQDPHHRILGDSDS